MQTVSVQQDFSLPVDRVYAYLAEHENLGPLFGLKVTRVKDGDTSRNGVGSVRMLKLGPLPAFRETVTEAVDDALIRYRITEGSPLRDHEGVMRFTPTPSGGTHLDYEIRFSGKVPGLAPVVAVGLKRNVVRGLRQVETRA